MEKPSDICPKDFEDNNNNVVESEKSARKLSLSSESQGQLRQRWESLKQSATLGRKTGLKKEAGSSLTLPSNYHLQKTSKSAFASFLAKLAIKKPKPVPSWAEWKTDLSSKKHVKDFYFLSPEDDIFALKIEFGLVEKPADQIDQEDCENQTEKKATVRKVDEVPAEATTKQLLDKYYLNNIFCQELYEEAEKPLTMTDPLYGPRGVLNKPVSYTSIDNKT